MCQKVLADLVDTESSRQ